MHIHVPEGAIPKDGPSAGVTMAAALISALSQRPLRHDLAMTGEITLRGRVLPIGGLKEKVIAAHRARLKIVIIPERNKKDLVDVPRKVQHELNIVRVDRMEDLLALALLPRVTAVAWPKHGRPKLGAGNSSAASERPKRRPRKPALPPPEPAVQPLS